MHGVISLVLQRRPANLAEIKKVAAGIVRGVARVDDRDRGDIEDTEFVRAGADYGGFVVEVMGVGTFDGS